MTKFIIDDLYKNKDNQLKYYKIVPNTSHKLLGIWPNNNEVIITCNEIISQSLKNQNEFENKFDYLQAGIFNLISKNISLPKEVNWNLFLKFLNNYYVKMFNIENSKSIRKSAQRLNFFIQYGLYQNKSSHNNIVNHKKLKQKFCWDYVKLENLNGFKGECYISSEKEKNFHFLNSNKEVSSFKVGLPTQLDISLNNILYIGSCYSEGFWSWDGYSLKYNNHEFPVLLVCQNKDKDFYFFNAKGELFKNNYKVFKSPIKYPGKARYFNNKIYITDWLRSGFIYCINLETIKGNWIPLLGVYLVNDICLANDYFYIVDKQQGFVLKYDKNFKFIPKSLHFGVGKGRLYDPISIRLYNETLIITSWITGEYNQINVF